MHTHNSQKGISALVVVVIIALIAVAGGAIFYKMSKTASYTAMQTNTSGATGTPVVTGTTGSSGSSMVSNDSTDAGLAQDSANLDTQLKASDKDTANIDSGINDQQGNLSEQ